MARRSPRRGVSAGNVLRPPQVRGANRGAVLSLLQQNGCLSRADISRHSGLSEGAISRIITELIDEKLICEDGAENTTGGRPGRRLKLQPSRVVFGAEIQNWETRCAVCTMQGRLVETRRFRTPASSEDALEQIASALIDFRKTLRSDRLPGIGICARGVVDSDSGTLVIGSRPGWRHVPIRQVLESRLREPVFVENNVRAAALAEYTYGAPENLDKRCFLFVKIDEGVGVGIIFDGRLYHGPHMAAGEFGQMVISLSAGGERHDRPGCLERLISNPATCLRYSESATDDSAKNRGNTDAQVRRIAASARAGEERARQTIEETSRYLGVGLSNIIWGLDTDAVIIDGAITEAWAIVEPVLRRQLPDDLELWNARDLLVRPSALGGEAALIGAASLPLKTIFEQEAPARSAAPAVR